MTDEPEFTLSDIFRIETKARDQGFFSLTEGERAILRAGDAFLERIAASIPADMVEHASLPDGKAAPARDRLTPADRMRYSEWSEEHLEVFLPLIAEWASGGAAG
jgi:hypothetical protein